MTREEAVKLATQLGKAVNAHDIPALMSCYAEDAVMFSPVFNEVRGVDEIARTWETTFASFPDWKVQINDVLVDGDRIALLGSSTTTDRKGWFGLPPTGAPISIRAAILLTFANGKIVRDERVYDLGAVLEHMEKARIDQELRTAAEVQSALMPQTIRSGSYYEAAGDSLPCRAIGGDFFEFLELPSGNCAVAVGDVAGKGPAAALLASMMQGMLASEARSSARPAEILHELNRALLARRLGYQFASLVYGVLSPDGAFLYSNAGHNPPLELTRNGIRRLSTGGPVLGAVGDAEFEEQELRMEAGDALILFSDGVTEARNHRDEEFGEDRLVSCVGDLRERPAGEIAKAVLGAVRQFGDGTQQSDDITVAVVRFR